MATTVAKNYMRAEADKRLIANVERLASLLGMQAVNIPTRMRDKELLNIRKTEQMADFIAGLCERFENDNGDDVHAPREATTTATYHELLKQAKAQGIADTLSGSGKNGALTKSDLMEALYAGH